MRTRNSNFPNNSNVTIPRRQNRGRAPNVVEPELRTIVEVAPMAERTMEELLRAPTEGYGEAIVLPEINADHFEIKTNLLQLVQANPFHGYERENPHAHINSFKRITSTLRFRDVPNDVIKLMMFPYSLEGNARLWYEKEPPNSILTWEDLVTKFERFKEMLRACPHHGFTELTQVDTFYNGLNENDQDSLNAAAGGNLLSKTTREALNIIENKCKVRYSHNKSNVSKMNTTSRESVSKTDERIDKLADQLSTLVEIVSKKVVTPSPVKAVEEICVTCSGPHAWYNCPNTDNNQASVCAATGSYNQVNPQNHVSNQMAPPVDSFKTKPQLQVLFRVIPFQTRRVRRKRSLLEVVLPQEYTRSGVASSLLRIDASVIVYSRVSMVALSSRVPSARVVAVAVCQNCLTRESWIVSLRIPLGYGQYQLIFDKLELVDKALKSLFALV
ncbi:hypothetical protein Tco_0496540 [Tanacetum coccineum]